MSNCLPLHATPSNDRHLVVFKSRMAVFAQAVRERERLRPALPHDNFT